MLAGHSGVLARIRHAGKAICTNENARMPRAASGYFSAIGPFRNTISAATLMASSQNAG